MLVDSHGLKHLDEAHRAQLRSSSLGRKRRSHTPARAVLASALVAVAKRLVPEIQEPTVLRARAAPH